MHNQQYTNKQMNGKTYCLSIFLLVLALSAISLEAREDFQTPLRQVEGYYEQFERDYIVKSGDVFFIGIIGSEPNDLVSAVNISGNIILHPLTSAIHVGGKSLGEARQLIIESLMKLFHDVEINVELRDISPQRIHFFGAVNKPGEYVVDSLATLYQSLSKAGGLSPAASKKIRLIRRGDSRIYNLNDYLLNGNVNENPLMLNNDVVFVDFAKSYAKLYVVTDSVNYIEYFEIEDEPLQLGKLLVSIRNKYRYSDYQNVMVLRNDKTNSVDKDFLVNAGDRIFLKSEESYVYVHGNVEAPGKVVFVPGKLPDYYISNSGGVTRAGSSGRVFIVQADGNRVRYRNQKIQEGDSIVVPLSTRAFITDYLTPISTILSIVTTIIILTR